MSAHKREVVPPSLRGHLLPALALILMGPLLVRAQEGEPKPLGLLDVVRMTLDRQPEIKLAEEQVRFAEGTLQAEEGAFDVRFGSTLSADHQTTPLLGGAIAGPGATTRTNSWAYTAEASRLFKSGTVLTPSVRVGRITTDYSSLVENRSRLGFTLLQPLLRGRGADGVAAPSREAALERDATALDLRHGVATRVLETVGFYWRYVAEVRRLEIARDSENRFVDLQATSARLLAAREIAAVDIKQLSAVVLSRRLSRIEGEQRVIEARTLLGIAAGLEATALASLGAPADAFPKPEPTAESGDLSAWIATALSRRSDLQSAKLRQQSAGVSVGAFQNAARPTLDLLVDASYAGGVDKTGIAGFVDPLVNNLRGPSAFASLTFGWPNSNRTALGHLAESRALSRQAEISLADLERRIGGQVALSLSNFVKSGARVVAAREAVDLYRETLTAERQRQQLGLSSLLDVINTEDRLNDSLFEAVSADLDYAVAIAALRFELGALVRPAASGYEVDLTLLTTPPLPDSAR